MVKKKDITLFLFSCLLYFYSTISWCSLLLLRKICFISKNVREVLCDISVDIDVVPLLSVGDPLELEGEVQCAGHLHRAETSCDDVGLQQRISLIVEKVFFDLIQYLLCCKRFSVFFHEVEENFWNANAVTVKDDGGDDEGDHVESHQNQELHCTLYYVIHFLVHRTSVDYRKQICLQEPCRASSYF